MQAIQERTKAAKREMQPRVCRILFVLRLYNFFLLPLPFRRFAMHAGVPRDGRRTWRQFEINNAAGQDNVSSVVVPSLSYPANPAWAAVYALNFAPWPHNGRENWRYIIRSRINDSIRKLEGRLRKVQSLNELGGTSKIEFSISSSIYRILGGNCGRDRKMQNGTMRSRPSLAIRSKSSQAEARPFAEDIVSKALPIRSGFVASPGLRSRLSFTKERREVAPARPTLKAGAKETILHAEWYHRRSLGTAFKTTFVYDPVHFPAHVRTHSRTHARRSRCTLKLAISTTGENEEGTNANERAGTSHRRREFVP